MSEREICVEAARRFLEDYWYDRDNASGFSSGDVQWLADLLQEQRNAARGDALRGVVGRLIGDVNL